MRVCICSALLAVSAGLVSSCSSDTQETPPGTVATPTVSPAPTDFGAPLEVALATTTGGATIHFTTDGSEPTEASPAYADPFTITATTTIKAIATCPGMYPSAVATATYTHRLVNLQADGGTWGPNGGTSIARTFMMLKEFTPAPGDFPFQLRTIGAAFFTQSLGVPIRLAVYSDADGDVSNGATLEATYDVTVLNNGDEVSGMTWSVYELSPPVSLDGPGDVLIGWVVLDRDDFNWPLNEPYEGGTWLAFWHGTVPDPPALPPDWGYVDNGYNALIRGSN